MQRFWRAAVLWCGGCAFLIANAAVAQQASDTTQEESAPSRSVPTIRAIPLIQAAPAVKASPATPAVQEEAVAVETKPISPDVFEASHAEVAPLVPQHDGQRVTLNTFRLDADNNIVACVAAGEGPQGFIQVYAPDLTLKHEFATPFVPTAIALDPSGNLIAGGNGKVGKFAADGTVLKLSDAPNVSGQDPEKMRREIVEQYKQSMQEVVKNYESQIETLQTSIEELETKESEDAEAFSKRDANRLKAMRRQLESYEAAKSQFSGELPEEQITAMMQYRSSIPSITANAQDVFVTTSSGMGYEVWRTDHNFENPERILSGLRGCCGQMDIFANDQQLLVAENTRFEVGLYDRDGVRQAAFGERAQGTSNGFGSCCNPMNVICCGNGDILTAESSIGKIKRFNADGDLIGYVGKARIGGGCKHVALGYDTGRDRYYIQYQDKNQICILVPNSEAEKLLAEKRAVQAAGEKIVAKFAGDWTLDKSAEQPKPAQTEAANEAGDEENVETQAFDYAQFVEQLTGFQLITIELDSHKFIATLGGDGTEEVGPGERQNLRWNVVAATETQVSLELEGEDGMVMYGAEITLVNDDTIRVRFSYDAVQQFGKEKVYVRAAVPTSTEAGQ